MKTGLFFGSFNPVHVGHMIIANYMLNHTDLENVWLVISPHNPLKKKKTLARDYDRLYLVNLAIGDELRLKASDIEFGLQQPSYTIDTMTYLDEKYPDREFTLIMGGDNLANLHKWKNYEMLLEKYRIYIYRRPTCVMPELQNHPNVVITEAPLLEISSSYIRELLREKKSVKYLVPDKVHEYLNDYPIYDRLPIQ
ncbi:MAG: nicotinate (nicotinamide) nucleotide adenylyltransferase [Saprospiraceae bacterium]